MLSPRCLAFRQAFFFSLKSLLFIGSAFLSSGVAYASCFDDLQRPESNLYQPISTCDSSNIHDCFDGPPSLAILSIPTASLPEDIRYFQTSVRTQAAIKKLFSDTLASKTYWKFYCEALPGNSFRFYNCYDPITNELLLDSYPVYLSGVVYNSSKTGITYTTYSPSALDGYFSEYTCHPTDGSVIHLRQYHFGHQVRIYKKRWSPAFLQPHCIFHLPASTLPFEVVHLPTSS